MKVILLDDDGIVRIGMLLPSVGQQDDGADYRNAAGLTAGAVLLVGSAQSGVQIAEDLVAGGRTVYLCTSSVGRMPRRYRGRDIFGWLGDIGFFDQEPGDLPDVAVAKNVLMMWARVIGQK